MERRDGEVAASTPAETIANQHKIGRSLLGRVIKLKEGTQSYVATFFAQPELAKKDSKKMFSSIADGGHFERIFSGELTAEKFAIAHEAKQAVDGFVKSLLAAKKRKDRGGELAEYRTIFGDAIIQKFGEQIDQVIRQIAVFLCGSVFKDYVEGQGKEPADLPQLLRSPDGRSLMAEHIGHLLEYAHSNPKKFNKSWPNLLKSSAFFNEAVAYIRGIRSRSRGT